jgi:hypothetical protein
LGGSGAKEDLPSYSVLTQTPLCVARNRLQNAV